MARCLWVTRGAGAASLPSWSGIMRTVWDPSDITSSRTRSSLRWDTQIYGHSGNIVTYSILFAIWLPLTRLPHHAPIPCHIPPLHNCHHIKLCSPSRIVTMRELPVLSIVLCDNGVYRPAASGFNGKRPQLYYMLWIAAVLKTVPTAQPLKTATLYNSLNIAVWVHRNRSTKQYVDPKAAR